jgi:heme exporter protein C
VLAALSGVLLIVTLVLVFVQAPVEATMGIVQKIFYFHVPSAYAMYLAWGTCAVGSVAYLVGRREGWDALARSAAELALVFAVLVLITGPLWGRKSWGAFWAWDPRLTSTLLLTLIITSYALLRGLGRGGAERRFAAALGILGACVVPIIHLSVSQWRGQHPTVIGSGGGGMAPEMKLPFACGLAAFTLLFAALLWIRYRIEIDRRQLARLEQRALMDDLLAEEPDR